jgi:hypothetical protein
MKFCITLKDGSSEIIDTPLINDAERIAIEKHGEEVESIKPVFQDGDDRYIVLKIDMPL